jgi:ketosteroid isomerase-like protein
MFVADKTNTMKKLLYLFLITFYFSACRLENGNDSAKALEQAKRAIEESNAIYFDSFVKNDSTIFIARYAEDACIMAPNAVKMCGQKAAADFFKVAYQQIGLRNGKFITTAVYGQGPEFVTEEGLWQSFDEQGKLFDDGKFLVLWKKTNAGWKMFRDSFSSNHASN